MNSVTLQGNLAADPVVRDVNGTQVASFTVAATERYKKNTGEFVDDTQFIDCEVWNAAVKTVSNWTKGEPVLITGRLKKDVWEKDGNKQYKIKVRVDNFKRFARFPKQEVSQEAQPEVAVGVGEDIPF